MRGGVDVKNLSLFKGGISTFLRAVLPGLVDLDTSIRYIAIGPAEGLLGLPSGMEQVPLELSKWLGSVRLPVYDQWQLRCALNRKKVDLFYSPYFDAPLGMCIPTVVTMCDAVHFRYSEFYPWRQRVYYKSLMRLHGSRASAIVTISEFSKAELVELVGINPDKIHVISLALPLSFVPPLLGNADPEILRRYNLPSDYVLYTGGVEVRKNIGGMLKAYTIWQELRRDIPPLVLTGDKTRFELYRDELEKLGIGRGVYFVGRVTDEHLPHIYAGALSVIYPSFYEGFGFPLLEAMASGVPIVCSRRASMPEIGGNAAFYFEPDQPDDIIAALEAVTGSLELRAELVAKGNIRLQDFTLDKTIKALGRVIASVIGS
ncbi:MAG: glycosyltransferase family 1 protein [Eubacteriales bacterium]|jgi:glycosyltransferase involved in cell wall biosynthesis